MRIRFTINLSLSCLATLFLLGVSDKVSADTQSAAQVQKAVASKVQSVGARAQRVGNTVSIVTYRGGPKNYVTCRTSGGKAIGGYALDSRTTVQVTGRKARARTLYLVTAKFQRPTRTTPLTIAFTRSGVGKFENGVSCRATGNLERFLLGS